MEKYDIFVDMDGVLARWQSAAAEEELLEPGYFANLVPEPNMVSAVRILSQREDVNLRILSAYLTDVPYPKADKMKWLARHMPFLKPDQVCLVPYGTDKSKIQGFSPRAILLDDYTPNCIDWNRAGGAAIKVMNGINGPAIKWSQDGYSDPLPHWTISVAQSPHVMASAIMTYAKQSAVLPRRNFTRKRGKSL